MELWRSWRRRIRRLFVTLRIRDQRGDRGRSYMQGQEDQEYILFQVQLPLFDITVDIQVTSDTLQWCTHTDTDIDTQVHTHMYTLFPRPTVM